MYLPNCKTNLVIALHILSPLFCKFINTIAYHLGRYEPSPTSTMELHDLSPIIQLLIVGSIPSFEKCKKAYVVAA